VRSRDNLLPWRCAKVSAFVYSGEGVHVAVTRDLKDEQDRGNQSSPLTVSIQGCSFVRCTRRGARLRTCTCTYTCTSPSPLSLQHVSRACDQLQGHPASRRWEDEGRGSQEDPLRAELHSIHVRTCTSICGDRHTLVYSTNIDS